ncbi:MAG: RecQ family ATP-dependent DNA helicase [Treponema sp.]|nr:RecQ family ATP-dependent DNA helicase [Treponema sp.]
MDKYEVLHKQFGYTSFRPGQEEAIDAILTGQDVIAIMPTGAGKSLCYQIPALLLPGITLVISPLISLMKDQVKALNESGCPAVFLNSSLSSEEYQWAMDEILCERAKLIYVAPERLFKHDISLLASSGHISLVVVDEAHCVSQWGHDFRTSYLDISRFVRSMKKRPILAAFTATATMQVRRDIEELLSLKKALRVHTGFDRPNLRFEVLKTGKAYGVDKKKALLHYLSSREDESGIIYCATRKAVEETYALLQNRGYKATRYHAGLDDAERRSNQDDFLYDRSLIMVATNAFGMGIDKSNVSYVIHFNMPKNIESYYQEAGRAGRDGSPADCILLYSGQDVQINKFLITRSNDDAFNPERESHNLELLKEMTFYATSSRCLRHRLLAYFGEESPASCNNCSNCLGHRTITQGPVPSPISVPSQPRPREQEPAAPVDEALFVKLKGLRKEIAQNERMPAYIIFSDASLKDMCRKKPLSPAQFSMVSGVGQVKREKYGQTFTALIKEHLAQTRALL